MRDIRTETVFSYGNSDDFRFVIAKLIVTVIGAHMCACYSYNSCSHLYSCSCSQLDKVYPNNGSDLVERFEEMNRMREEAMREYDKDGDHLISLAEFLEYSKAFALLKIICITLGVHYIVFLFLFFALLCSANMQLMPYSSSAPTH